MEDPRVPDLMRQIRALERRISNQETKEKPIVITDHGDLNGLSGDDHPQYLLQSSEQSVSFPPDAFSLSTASFSSVYNRRIIVFPDAAVGIADTSFILPPGWTSSNMYVILQLGTNANGNVAMNYEIRRDSHGLVLSNTALDSDSNAITMYSGQGIKQVSPALSLSGCNAGDGISLRVYRYGTHATDTLTADLWMFGVGVYFS